MTLPCQPNHTFHKDCILRWSRIKNSCPICRSEINLRSLLNSSNGEPSNNSLLIDNYESINEILSLRERSSRSFYEAINRDQYIDIYEEDLLENEYNSPSEPSIFSIRDVSSNSDEIELQRVERSQLNWIR